MSSRKKIPDPERQIAYLKYVNLENEYHHPYHDEDMKQFMLMQQGDPAAVAESRKMMIVNQVTQLSKDPLENIKFLFVSCVTLASRFAVEGGMDHETSFNTSDMYIRNLYNCKTVDDVLDLHSEMMEFYTSHMASLHKEQPYSRPVMQCLDYIETHLHTAVRVNTLAEMVNLSSNYLSSLFKLEVGQPISDYVLSQKVNAAKNMLRFSDYTSAYITEVLAFSSQSHFIKAFKKIEGITPKEYRNIHYRDGISKS